MLCGEDYQGYSVIQCKSGRVEIYFPDEGFDGGGFCWAAVHPSPDGLTLAVEGCYWACPYEIVFYDFTDPMVLPLKELARIDDFDEVIGWDNKSTFSYTVSEDSREQKKSWNRTSVP